MAHRQPLLLLLTSPLPCLMLLLLLPSLLPLLLPALLPLLLLPLQGPVEPGRCRALPTPGGSHFHL